MARSADYVRKKLEGTSRALPLVSFPLSLGYEAIVSLRNTFYDRGLLRTRQLPLPVISVGNLTLGGTGKTPAVIMLARLLQECGFRPAVVSRGYGGRNRDAVTVVSDGRSISATPEEAGDEPVLIAESLENIPVVTARRRVDAGRAVLQNFEADLLILDDAFQHRSLFRDVDIVLVDGDRPFGNGCIIPGGTLREPPGGIRRSHFIIVTDSPPDFDAGIIERVAPGIPIFMAQRRSEDLLDCSDGTVRSPEFLQNKRVTAFAGIAFPRRFRETLLPWCGSLEAFFSFPDHHIYDERDIRKIRAADADIIVTTEKDGVRLRRFPEIYRSLQLFRIGMRIVPSPKELMATLCGKLRQ
ncbi:MAG TPA: tetraacyldisaccharide 4'-kinase [Deltaproteobacteria bacterium]|mgnify:CR=1 FL=1|nr:tetraacyldisaccharide 4'-kinase [Deltaproteobacteria bacterium]